MRQSYDWKYFDIFASEQKQEERPLQSLEEATCPEMEWGEFSGIRKPEVKFKSMYYLWLDDLMELTFPEILGISHLAPSDNDRLLSNPFPPYHPRMTQLDNHEYEGGYVVSNKILWPHIHNTSHSHLGIEYIMKRIPGCTAQQARDLADEMAVLDCTPKMVNEYCKEARAKENNKPKAKFKSMFSIWFDDLMKSTFPEFQTWLDDLGKTFSAKLFPKIPEIHGIDKLINKLYPFVLGAEEGNNSTQDWNKAETFSERALLQGIFGQAGLREGDLSHLEIDDEDYDHEYEGADEKRVPTIGYHILEDFQLKQEKINNLRGLYDWEFIQELQNKPLDFVEDLWNKHFSWEARQPAKIHKMANAIQNASSDKLKVIGQRLQNESKTKLSHDQRSYLWSKFFSKKSKLLKLKTPISKRLLKKIKATLPGKTGSVGQLLHKIQSKEIKLESYPLKHEWTTLWNAYKEIKETA